MSGCRPGLFSRRSLRSVSTGVIWTIFRRNDSKLAAGSHVVSKSLFGSRNRVLIFVKQVLDSQGNLHITLAVHSLTGTVFLGRQHWKLRLPITQHMRLHTGELTYLTNL